MTTCWILAQRRKYVDAEYSIQDTPEVEKSRLKSRPSFATSLCKSRWIEFLEIGALRMSGKSQERLALRSLNNAK